MGSTEPSLQPLGPHEETEAQRQSTQLGSEPTPELIAEEEAVQTMNQMLYTYNLERLRQEDPCKFEASLAYILQ